MSSAAGSVQVVAMDAANAADVIAFADREPLVYTDFASIAHLMPPEPRVLTARRDEGVVAAVIDDGLAVSVGGETGALRELSRHVSDLERKLVVAGRLDEVRAFVEHAREPRRERHEHFMAVARGALRHAPEPIPLRIAEEGDLPMLAEVRARALEEEYGMRVERDGELFAELQRAVMRAVAMQGVAIWVEDDRVAFTAQLIAKTERAATFGDLYTDPELRGAGRATRALTAFCAWLMTESEHVTLRVGVDNVPAVRLYERVGFDVVDHFMSSLRGDQPGPAGQP